MKEYLLFAYGIIFLIVIVICVVQEKRKNFSRFTDKKTLEDFDVEYNEILSRVNVDVIKKEHIRNVSSLIIGVIIILAGYGIGISMVIKDSMNLGLPAIIMIASTFFGGLCFVGKRDFNYKHDVVKNLVAVINPDIKYMPKNHNVMLSDIYSEAEFKENISGTSYRDYDVKNYFYEREMRHELDDYMEYQIDSSTNVRMGNLKLKEYEYDRSSDDHSRRTIFEGMIVKISRNKESLKWVLIERNKTFRTKDKISATSQEFERYFDISALSKEHASIVTPEIEQELVKLYKESGLMFEISVRRRSIYIRFFTGEMFENSKLFSGIDKKRLCKQYRILKSIVYITNKVNEMF